MATKLNQIIAVEKGVKAKATRDFTDAHHIVQKTPLLSGISRTYQPKDDDGDQLPPESTQVQVRAGDVLEDVATCLTRLFDITLTKDTANAFAAADLKVDGQVIANNVPVTYLLFLEKQLVDLRTFMVKLPTLDPAETWSPDPSGAWVAEPAQTAKTKKVPHNHVKAEATQHHPAQVEMWYEDTTVGYWTTKKFSGALPALRVQALVARVDALTEAVKYAREEANSTEVADAHIGKKVFEYLLA